LDARSSAFYSKRLGNASIALHDLTQIDRQVEVKRGDVIQSSRRMNPGFIANAVASASISHKWHARQAKVMLRLPSSAKQFGRKQ
jgi:hypothetical protein